MGECSPGLRRVCFLSFLCSKTISVVFRGGTGIYTSSGGDGMGWRVSPCEGVDWAWHHYIVAWVVLGKRYRYYQYR